MLDIIRYSELPKNPRLVDLIDYVSINMTREELEAWEPAYQSMKNATRSYDQFLRWCDEMNIEPEKKIGED